MFETLLNAIIISVMVVINCDNPVVIRDDRVFRYVGNSSDDIVLAKEDEALDVHKKSMGTNSQTFVNSFQNIPESILIQMKDITNVNEFIANFFTANDNKANKDIYVEYLERGSGSSDLDNNSKEETNFNEERRKLTKLPKIAAPAGCVPEMKVIDLQTTHISNGLYFPSCIRMARCSGCCPSQRLRCVPTNTSFEDITVIGIKYSMSEKRLKFDGFKVFRIERHDKCRCDCIQKASDCNPNQIYSESECRCLCPNTTDAIECQNSYNKYWDYTHCQCYCKSVPFCSTGFAFDNSSCRCEAEVESEEESILNHSDDSSDSYNRLTHRYVPDREDAEILVQSNRDLIDGKGINPDIDDDYHEKSDFL